MDPIAEVNITRTSFCVHDFGTRSAPALVCMRCFIRLAGISFGFSNYAGGKPVVDAGNQYLSQKIFCEKNHIIMKVITAFYFRHGRMKNEMQIYLEKRFKLSVNSIILLIIKRMILKYNTT